MNRILMAAAVVLVSATPLAFAAASGNSANSGIMSSAYLTTEHCPNLEQQFSTMKFKSEAAKQVAEEKADSLCRQDKHKNGGAEAGNRAKPANLLLMKG